MTNTMGALRLCFLYVSLVLFKSKVCECKQRHDGNNVTQGQKQRTHYEHVRSDLSYVSRELLDGVNEYTKGYGNADAKIVEIKKLNYRRPFWIIGHLNGTARRRRSLNTESINNDAETHPLTTDHDEDIERRPRQELFTSRTAETVTATPVATTVTAIPAATTIISIPATITLIATPAATNIIATQTATTITTTPAAIIVISIPAATTVTPITTKIPEETTTTTENLSSSIANIELTTTATNEPTTATTTSEELTPTVTTKGPIHALTSIEPTTATTNDVQPPPTTTKESTPASTRMEPTNLTDATSRKSSTAYLVASRSDYGTEYVTSISAVIFYPMTYKPTEVLPRDYTSETSFIASSSLDVSADNPSLETNIPTNSMNSSYHDSVRTAHQTEFSYPEILTSANQLIATSSQIQAFSELPVASTLKTSTLISVNIQNSLVTHYRGISVPSPIAPSQTHPITNPTSNVSLNLTPHLTPHLSFVSFQSSSTTQNISVDHNINNATIYEIISTTLNQVQILETFHSQSGRIHHDSSLPIYDHKTLIETHRWITSSVSRPGSSTSVETFHFQMSSSANETETPIFRTHSGSEVITSHKSMTVSSDLFKQLESMTSDITGPISITLTDALVPETNVFTHTDLNTEAHIDLHTVTHTDLHTETHIDLHTVNHTDLHTVVHTDLHTEAHIDSSILAIHSGNIRTIQTINVSSPSLTDITNSISFSSTITQMLWTINPTKPSTSLYISTIAFSYTSTTEPSYTSTTAAAYTSSIASSYTSTIVPSHTSTAAASYTSTTAAAYTSSIASSYTSTIVPSHTSTAAAYTSSIEPSDDTGLIASLDFHNVTTISTTTSPPTKFTITLSYTTNDCTSLVHSPYIEELKLKLNEFLTKLSQSLNPRHISVGDPQCAPNTIIVSLRSTNSSSFIQNLENFILRNSESTHFDLGPEGNRIVFNITSSEKVDVPRSRSPGAWEVTLITTAVCICTALIIAGVVLLIKEYYHKKLNKRIDFIKSPNFLLKPTSAARLQMHLSTYSNLEMTENRSDDESYCNPYETDYSNVESTNQTSFTKSASCGSSPGRECLDKATSTDTELYVGGLRPGRLSHTLRNKQDKSPSLRKTSKYGFVVGLLGYKKNDENQEALTDEYAVPQKLSHRAEVRGISPKKYPAPPPPIIDGEVRGQWIDRHHYRYDVTEPPPKDLINYGDTVPPPRHHRDYGAPVPPPRHHRDYDGTVSSPRHHRDVRKTSRNGSSEKLISIALGAPSGVRKIYDGSFDNPIFISEKDGVTSDSVASFHF